MVEIRGVDVYDPTTGAIRSDSTDEIACWFLDTAYSEEAFFVRHAYFAGGDRPYEKLAKTLRAEIDEAAWESLDSTVSRPFERPSAGKIAMKVIGTRFTGAGPMTSPSARQRVIAPGHRESSQ